ncbi:hypothetical protein BJ138DRAFT_1220414 [Hygrophoropsis aurantiaca]|uniref:Uncharacterized protein n=1 Tax=Hygrophoropsis aurantiaca TaxID=72124 RepID=A0ACB8A0V3_9AGAM|nr:hypothetical protein BJ138DRAFT_1220414 [Hygrophoropsis aurantiaca]
MFSTKFIAAIAMTSVLQGSSGLVARRDDYDGGMSVPSSQIIQTPMTATSTHSSQSAQSTESQTKYTAGSQTVFTSELWIAKQWSYNNPPNDAAMEWTLVGIPAWNKQTQYNRGSQVTYSGHLWFAPNWVSSNVPGDKSGSWVDEGACMD